MNKISLKSTSWGLESIALVEEFPESGIIHSLRVGSRYTRKTLIMTKTEKRKNNYKHGASDSPQNYVVVVTRV